MVDPCEHGRPARRSGAPALRPTIRTLVTGSRDFDTLKAAINARIADEVDKAARLGFCLVLSLTSHAVRGDCAWLAEALRLAGQDVTVEVRHPNA